MKRTVVFSGLSAAAWAWACGLGTTTMGCGSAPDSADVVDLGRGANDNAGSVNNTDWVQRQYPATLKIVQSFLALQEDLKGRVIGRVTPLYRRDVEGPAYLNFALRLGSEDAGQIIASTGSHDVPIFAWSDRGSAVLPSFEKHVQRDLGGARIFMSGIGAFAAEFPDGSIVSSHPSIAPETSAATKSATARVANARSLALKSTISDAWRRAASASGTDLPADVSALVPCPIDGCGAPSGDLCKPNMPNYPACMCPGCGNWKTRGHDRVVSPSVWLPPNYLQFITSWGNGYCKSGCTPTSLSMIAAWVSHQAGDHRDGSVWGHPRMLYAFDNQFGDAWAPDTFVMHQASTWRSVLGTFCSGDTGLTSFNFPSYNRISDLSGQHFNNLGAPIDTAGYYHGSWEGYAGYIENEARGGRPVVINAMENPAGNNAHTWVIWGYNKSFFGEEYGSNLTWPGWDHVWLSKGNVLWYLTDPDTSGADGAGIVMFRPKTTLTRDHGPITTGAGGDWCLDVAGADVNIGQIVQQYGCHGGNNQLWYLDRAPGMAGWQIRNKNSGQCLAAWGGGGSYNGAQIVQWTCDPNDTNTLWRISKWGTLNHVMSNRCLDLDSAGGMAGYGKKIQVWDCNYNSNQRFDFGY